MNEYTRPMSASEAIAVILGAALLIFTLENYGIWFLLITWVLVFVVFPVWWIARWLLTIDWFAL